VADPAGAEPEAVSALHSTRWHRVAGLRPRLATQLRVRRQRIRGQDWILLTPPAGGRTVRLNAAAWSLAARLDGRMTVQQLWDQRLAAGEDPPPQDEVIELLAQLREAALLQFDRDADFDLLLTHLERIEKPRGRQSLLAWRIPLADPSALLDRLQGLGPLLFRPATAWLWAAAVAMLALLAVQHFPALWAHGAAQLGTPGFLLLAALAYVPVKALHELAHGLAVRHWGGQVREAGVTLMLGWPVPYVDASAATGFVQRRRRVLVSAAGIMTELAVAAAALPLWLWLEDGTARDAAFATLFITGVSTLLFNANPLRRMDGYYVMTDLLDLPNLGLRSRRWWGEQLQRGVQAARPAERMPVARGEVPWLFAYAPLAWAWLLVVATLAVAWLGSMSLVLGSVAALLLGWQLVCLPAWRLLVPLRRAALAQAGSAGRWRRLLLGGGTALAVLALLPLPQRTMVQGVVWPPEHAQLRSNEDGFVAEVLIADGDLVEPGTPVLRLVNPQLQADLQRQLARVDALEAALFGALPGMVAARAGDASAELGAARAAADHLRQRVHALTVRAHAHGHAALPGLADLPGHPIERGRLIGQVLTDDAPTVRVALPEAEVAPLRQAPRAVSVRLSSAPGRSHAAELLRDGGAAVRQLPSAALAERHGGRIPTEPGDASALQALRPVVLLDVQLRQAPEPAPRPGERAWVRVETGFAPLAWQAAQAVQRALAQRLHPAL